MRKPRLFLVALILLPLLGREGSRQKAEGGGTGLPPLSGHGQDGCATLGMKAEGGGTGLPPLSGHSQDGCATLGMKAEGSGQEIENPNSQIDNRVASGDKIENPPLARGTSHRASEHNPLLPRPQEIRYGGGQLPVQGLTIRFASPPSPDDRFAAEALNGSLASRGVAPLEIESSRQKAEKQSTVDRQQSTGGAQAEGSGTGSQPVQAQPGVAVPPNILLKREGEGPDLPMPDERPGPESREAYELSVTAKGAEIRAHASTGLFYGVQTLCQLVEAGGEEAEGRKQKAEGGAEKTSTQRAQRKSTEDTEGGSRAEGSDEEIDNGQAKIALRPKAFGRRVENRHSTIAAVLPEVEIRDWPALAYRGVMMDMSHGPLPTEEEVERQLDFLARWKENQYFFYSEASIELHGYPLVNPRGRFTQEQVRRIIAYGRERHIDVIPCLELYGHLHDLFRIEKYSNLAALPHGGEFNPANPQVLPLLTDWVNQFAQLFPSPFVHIGFDETWEIERAAKEQGAGATPAKLFVRQLGNVARLFQQHGKRVMLWGDIPIKYPEILEGLEGGRQKAEGGESKPEVRGPESEDRTSDFGLGTPDTERLILVAWEYDPRDPEYKRWMQPITARHLPHFIATGVNSWDEIAPDFSMAFENIDTFLAAGRKAGTLGLMNTVWSDDAQLLLRLSWPAMAYGAAAPWQSSPMDRAHFFSDYASAMYPPAIALEMAAALESLAQAEASLQKVLGQETMLELWKDPFTPAALKQSTEYREDLRQARLLAEDAEEHLCRAMASRQLPAVRGIRSEIPLPRLRDQVDSADLNSLLVGAQLIDYAGMKFQYAVEIGERWQDLGLHPSGDQVWVLFESEVTTSDHARLADLMDAISELREPYREAWLQEYAPYRLTSALGRWDAEYEYWRRLQARFRAFLASYHAEEPLPSLESVISGR